jgi:hypothetical protein
MFLSSCRRAYEEEARDRARHQHIFKSYRRSGALTSGLSGLSVCPEEDNQRRSDTDRDENDKHPILLVSHDLRLDKSGLTPHRHPFLEKAGTPSLTSPATPSVMYPAIKAFKMNGEAIRLLTKPRFWRLVISATMMVLTTISSGRASPSFGKYSLRLIPVFPIVNNTSPDYQHLSSHPTLDGDIPPATSPTVLDAATMMYPKQ